MAFFDKMVRKEDGIDIEEFLNNLDVEEESMYEDADAFVKPITLSSMEDVKTIISEAKQGNIVLLNIHDLSKRNALKLRECINSIKSEIDTINGDIARISQEKVLITPSKVKIIKKIRA